jgi:L-seryl-tRNA(Ser) seleniumtransferase
LSDARRAIPSLDRLIDAPAFRGLEARFSRARVVDGLRKELERVRALAADGGGAGDLANPEWYARAVLERLESEEVPSLRPVVNATGVILHTNLGRAPLAQSAISAMARAARGYSALEYDLEEGARGSRCVHCAELLRSLTGAEDALVVNNNAAALVLALNTLALGRSVLVSRGELVEIGGSFRVPEILERAGARLHEVGSTNRTRLADYAEAMTGEVGAVLKVHRSNFRITGFTEEVGLEALAPLAREAGVPLLHDLGSGLLLDPELLGLRDEPRVSDSVRRGADLITFSGDKLLGGPQAGIVIGRTQLVERLRRNPLCRALRVDKVTLAGLEATLHLYRDPGKALREIPALQLLTRPPQGLEARARALAVRLSAAGSGFVAEARPSVAVVGGGTCPDVEIASWSVRVSSSDPAPDVVAARLRQAPVPVVARVEDGSVVLDLRTVFEEEDDALFAALAGALIAGAPPAA